MPNMGRSGHVSHRTRLERPVFLTLAGGSFGLQMAAAGPVGRDTSAATDLEMHAEILTYSRSRGVFAAVGLDGIVVAPDHMADEALYGAGLHRETTLSGKVPVPEPARETETRRYTGSQKSARKVGS
jgi:Las17-binding protein actin regulator